MRNGNEDAEAAQHRLIHTFNDGSFYFDLDYDSRCQKLRERNGVVVQLVHVLALNADYFASRSVVPNELEFDLRGDFELHDNTMRLRCGEIKASTKQLKKLVEQLCVRLLCARVAFRLMGGRHC